mmetsp:Transcript_18994/g.40052  ORF Transcript_18994/g.40052 Transcript_18994/m.40052 type:complete len:594 (-) Transcript_18994:142-1923(-)|eukprot:CAMPEP_0183735958 /NCGR_PEP_ID=MMETSP0737-20130205/48067_1 /TAXON_ID=385413 /ORGANISM="Thalassiosira miniscula, Strain CCMP1093" /LENGTH=593 /DNA_ID=CAMNT_0025969839 /DNA_START=106 /DNA_END=1890 /DNA_ORIENTATION=-
MGEDEDATQTKRSSLPPSASAFLNKHTHHSDAEDALQKSASTVSVSNLIEGLVGGGSAAAADDDVSVSSMRHREESSRSYDQRLPKTMGGGEDESSSIPYRGFSGNQSPVVKNPSPERPVRSAPFANLRKVFRGLVSPRATDIQQLMIKLNKQFEILELDLEKYALELDGFAWDKGTPKVLVGKDSRKDPGHPLNNPKLMTEIHFVGRKALNSSIIDLSTLLINQDKFGCITELWLNDNLISDDGAAAIASYLQLPYCALVELWLGNNQIGPTGTTLLSGALSNNEDSQLKCLGLYMNPIGNGGASTLAQMLRRNHILSTLDVHGCGSRGGKGHEVLEGYGCKVAKANDGTEYVARVVASIREERDGLVTDHRFLDAIATFVAFNRINPTREQAIRGMMSSNKHVQVESADGSGDEASGNRNQTEASVFLSELCNKPANEKLTDDEKRRWKDCEWKRLHLELERARAAKSALANKLEHGVDVNENNAFEEEFTIDEEDGNMERLLESHGVVKREEMIGRNLDDEVVRTDCRSWRDLKIGITGSSRASPKQKKLPSNGENLHTISDIGNEPTGSDGPPKSAFSEGGVPEHSADA